MIKKIGVISLGCDKNRVDTENMLAILNSSGFSITDTAEEADIIIINTCGFLNKSREEAIEAIFEAVEHKENGTCEKIIVTGCLPQKYSDELFEEFKEVDAFLGTFDYKIIAQTITDCYSERVNNVGKAQKSIGDSLRILSTPSHYAYLKIADGCDNHCTYCTIPSIRGKYISRPINELVNEATSLASQGVVELIFVAQDVTSYGIDLYNKFEIVKLIQEISSVSGIERIRLLYCYPEKITDELIAEIASNDKVVKYLDIPLQHTSDAVLKRMGRFGKYDQYLALFKKLNDNIPNVALRTTFMVGFPGETDDDFKKLVSFINEVEIINCGVFSYSLEEDTPSAKLSGHLTEKIKNERYLSLLSMLEKRSKDIMSNFLGKTIAVLADGIDYDKNMFYGRSYFSAPDIDTLVYFTSSAVVAVGEMHNVRITSLCNNDLIGEEVL